MAKSRKTGGRQKGTPNGRTSERRTAIEALKLSGADPFMFFCQPLASEDAPFKERAAHNVSVINFSFGSCVTSNAGPNGAAQLY